MTGPSGAHDYEKALGAAGLGNVALFHREVTGSTNDDARAAVQSSPTLGEGSAALFVAESQTRGRGRGSNAWSSPLGSISLTLTAPGVETSRLSVLPLGVGAAVTRALRELGAPAEVKWPNDVLIEGRKVAGILCESSLLGPVARVFIGVGINIEGGAPLSTLPLGAAALEDHTREINRPRLVADIVARVLPLLRTPSPETIVDEWKAVAVSWWGAEATLIEGDTERKVTILDVNPEGQLVVREASGEVRALVSGEIRRIRVEES